MKKKAVVIRVSDEARKRLKIKALQSGHNSMLAYVDDLSKLTIKKDCDVLPTVDK